MGQDWPLNRCGARRYLMHLAVSEATMWSMTDDKVKRRLTTVLCADVHGYSRLGVRLDTLPHEKGVGLLFILASVAVLFVLVLSYFD